VKEQPGSVRETPSSDRSSAPGSDREIGISHSHSLSQFVAGKPKKPNCLRGLVLPRKVEESTCRFVAGPEGFEPSTFGFPLGLA